MKSLTELTTNDWDNFGISMEPWLDQKLLSIADARWRILTWEQLEEYLLRAKVWALGPLLTADNYEELVGYSFPKTESTEPYSERLGRVVVALSGDRYAVKLPLEDYSYDY